MLLPLTLMTFVVLSGPVSGQAPSPAQPPRDAANSRTLEASDAPVLARAWAALADGRAAEAVGIADRLLAREPWNHPALLVKLRGVAIQQGAVGALDVYEQWLTARGASADDDVFVLDPVAVAFLTELGRDSRIRVRVEALSRLAAAGSAAARADLDSLVGEGVVVDSALAGLGDKAALERLQTSVGGIGDQRMAVEAVASQGRSAVPVLIEALSGSKDSSTQAAAASALGVMGATEAVAPLRDAMEARDPYLRSSAAVALARLNDPAGLDYVQRMITSDIPDLQLMAAAASDGKPGPWVQAVRPLLQNRDGLIRLRAAQLIAPVDPDAARPVLLEGLADQNPVVRAESARVVQALSDGGVHVTGVADLRARLRDSDPVVRLHAASAILRLSRVPGRKP